MAKDPVCGMDVDEKRAAATTVYKGKTYYFCAEACKRAFEKDPQKYTKSSVHGAPAFVSLSLSRTSLSGRFSTAILD